MQVQDVAKSLNQEDELPDLLQTEVLVHILKLERERIAVNKSDMNYNQRRRE